MNVARIGTACARGAVLAVTVAATTMSHAPSAQAQSDACRVDGQAQLYAPTLNDFGGQGIDYVTRSDTSYWQDQGYLFGFERSDGDRYLSQPRGGYLVGGVILAADDRAASSIAREATQGWTAQWSPSTRETVDVPVPASDVAALRRLTPWEIDQDQPMSEIFVSFRYCNVAAHFVLTTMPNTDITAQATRYAEIMLQQMRTHTV